MAGEGKAHVSWAIIDSAHRDFHAVAARVLALSKTDRKAADALLDGEFSQKSMKIVSALNQLKRKAA